LSAYYFLDSPVVGVVTNNKTRKNTDFYVKI